MQLPQCRVSLVRSTQPPLHTVWLVGQLVRHWPPAQTLPLGQAFPHEPQLFTSLFNATQMNPAPPSTVAVQGDSPNGQAATHLLAWQICAAPQVVPQVPQLFESLVTSTHDWPHWVRPFAHEPEQAL